MVKKSKKKEEKTEKKKTLDDFYDIEKEYNDLRKLIKDNTIAISSEMGEIGADLRGAKYGNVGTPDYMTDVYKRLMKEKDRVNYIIDAYKRALEREAKREKEEKAKKTKVKKEKKEPTGRVKTHFRTTKGGKKIIVKEHKREGKPAKKKWVPPLTLKEKFTTPEDARKILRAYKAELKSLKELVKKLGGLVEAKKNPEYIARKEANKQRQRKYFEMVKKFQKKEGIGKFAGEKKQTPKEKPKKKTTKKKKEKPKTVKKKKDIVIKKKKKSNEAERKQIVKEMSDVRRDIIDAIRKGAKAKEKKLRRKLKGLVVKSKEYRRRKK